MRSSVLIVDDHEGFRSFARMLLETEGFDVIGDAEDGGSALAAARQLEPEVVVLDIQLPDVDGFEVAAQLAGLPHPPAVVLVSTRDEASYRRRAASSPACGFIAKHDLSGAAITALLAT